MAELEAKGRLDRKVEGLPEAAALTERAQAGKGLTRPEMAVLLAYGKIDLFDDIVASQAPDDPWFEATLKGYFPPALGRYGDAMSLVGPRPHALAHDEYYGAHIADYHKRFRTRPGITGLSQVKGFRGETETVADMEQRIRFDNHYIESWSILQDIWILVSTAVVVPLQRTAY